jgi:hypothetical protein
MVEFQPSKLAMRVRFPSPAPPSLDFSVRLDALARRTDVVSGLSASDGLWRLVTPRLLEQSFPLPPLPVTVDQQVTEKQKSENNDGNEGDAAASSFKERPQPR